MNLQNLIIFVAFCSIANASQYFTFTQIDRHFGEFKVNFNRTYGDEQEEAFRRAVFSANLDLITESNRLAATGQRSYTLAVNQFADYTFEEFKSLYLSSVHPGVKQPRYFAANDVHVNVTALPKAVDWSRKGLVTKVRNQGQCGSCWAFATVAAMEAQGAKKTGKLVELSEQNLVDCSRKYGTQGCNGGGLAVAYEYVIENKGIDTEASYPYRGSERSCRYRARNRGATISSYKAIPPGNEAALQQAVAQVGPVAIGIIVTNGFQLYKGGIYDAPNCPDENSYHAMAIVGYGEWKGQKYWKVKNSWDTNWGAKGYIYMKRNTNICEIANHAAYPLA